MHDAREKVATAGADGAMVGRALFGNPWFFNPSRSLPIRLNQLPTHGVDRETIIEADTTAPGVEYVSVPERLEALLEHSQLFVELLPHKSFNVMKKHYKAYVNGFPHAAELRTRLMEERDLSGVRAVVHEFLADYSAD
jgi:tRNA-dihydrouridine synthase